ncbi:hypothetical protein RJT34_12942 [Clitoria ternatea]|uniref:Uncharacterized protein n=1 Tax=Clitoria ternatea TaxID=43366 RepID=A0AAN9JN52_CLITE
MFKKETMFNVQRDSVANLQIFKVESYGRNLKKGRRNKCHWCQRSDYQNLIKSRESLDDVTLTVISLFSDT